MSRRQPYWASELRLSVSDQPEDDQPVSDQPEDAPLVSEQREEDRPTGFGVPVRWCALLALVALGLAAGGGSLLNSRRGRTVTSTVIRYDHPNGVDLSGCPRGDVCMPLPAPEAALGTELPPELAHASLLAGSLLLDTSTSRTIRTLKVLTTGGLTVTLTGQCIAGAAPVPARETKPTQPVPGGPFEVALVRPGQHAGCSGALIAQVPAGKPVPMQLLRRLADQLAPRLVN